MRSPLRWTLLVVLGVGCCASSVAQSLIPPTTAAAYGLTRAWYAQVGSNSATGELDHVNYDNGLVLVQSSVGMITAIDSETGRTLWETQVGSRRSSNSAPAANDEYVVVVNGSTVYAIKRADGAIAWQHQTSGAPGAGPAASNTHVFVPLVSGLIEGYDFALGAKQTPWNYKSAGRVLTRPMTTNHSLCWTTERGYLYSADPSALGVRYRLETDDEIHSRPAAWYPRLFACSTDGYVYAINEKTGAVDWRFPVGEPIYESPAAIDGKLFVVTEFDGMYCLSSENGTPLWHVSNVSQFISASPSRVYVRDRTGRMAILDLLSGARVGVMPLVNIRDVLFNSVTDRIFLVDHSCVIQCLHETPLASPVVYAPPEPEEPAEPALPPKRSPASEEPATDFPSEPAADEGFSDEPAAPADMPADDADNPFGDFP